MKGTDCTPEQIASADAFLRERGWSADSNLAPPSRQQIAHVMAWYGALRYEAGRDGTGGTLEHPGPFDTVTTLTPGDALLTGAGRPQEKENDDDDPRV